jgi:SPFH domain / Band 7 family
MIRAASSLQRFPCRGFISRYAVKPSSTGSLSSDGLMLSLVRAKSSYVFDGVGGGGGAADMWEWPITKTNTIFNIVPQGHRYIVERFGKLHEVHESGWFLAIPLVDRVAYVIDIRERALDIAPQAAITRDNGMSSVASKEQKSFVDLTFVQLPHEWSSFGRGIGKLVCSIHGRD